MVGVQGSKAQITTYADGKAIWVAKQDIRRGLSYSSADHAWRPRQPHKPSFPPSQFRSQMMPQQMTEASIPQVHPGPSTGNADGSVPGKEKGQAAAVGKRERGGAGSPEAEAGAPVALKREKKVQEQSKSGPGEKKRRDPDVPSPQEGKPKKKKVDIPILPPIFSSDLPNPSEESIAAAQEVLENVTGKTFDPDSPSARVIIAMAAEEGLEELRTSLQVLFTDLSIRAGGFIYRLDYIVRISRFTGLITYAPLLDSQPLGSRGAGCPETTRPFTAKPSALARNRQPSRVGSRPRIPNPPECSAQGSRGSCCGSPVAVPL